MSYVIGIVAHPKRRDIANKLFQNIKADLLNFDCESHGELWNHCDTLELLLKYDADYYVLLEDDAIPCNNFREHLEDYLSDCDGNQIVSLYLGTGRWAGTAPTSQRIVVDELVRQAGLRHDRWIKVYQLWHAVGIVIPKQYAHNILYYLQHNSMPTDSGISYWCNKNRVPVWYTCPSLVDHLDDVRLVNTEDQEVPRHAIKFGF